MDHEVFNEMREKLFISSISKSIKLEINLIK